MVRAGCWAWELSFWSRIQLERGDSVFIPDYFQALGIIFPSRRRWMLGSALFQAGSALHPPHPMDLPWADNEFLLGSGITALEEQGGSQPQEFLSKVQFSRGKYSSSCLFQQHQDLVADPYKFPGIWQQIHSNLWGFGERSIQICGYSVGDPSKFPGIQWQSHPNLGGFGGRSIQIRQPSISRRVPRSCGAIPRSSYAFLPSCFPSLSQIQ